MKRHLILATICLFFTLKEFGQSKSYWTSSLEMLFSGATIDDNGQSESSSLRWAPVINIQSMCNYDLSEKFGLFSGFAIRNVGYIYPGYQSVTPPSTVAVTEEKRFRSYNFGIPIGLKIGNLKEMFIYGGYEFEIPFLYKEKTYDNGDKTGKITGWFSDRQQSFYQSVLFGIQFPYGLNVKFKYYLTEFHNENFVDSNGATPYKGLKSNVFFVSLSSLIFTNTELNTYSSGEKRQFEEY